MITITDRNQCRKWRLIFPVLFLFVLMLFLTFPVSAQEDFEIPQNCDLVLYDEGADVPFVYEIRDGMVAYTHEQYIPAIDHDTVYRSEYFAKNEVTGQVMVNRISLISSESSDFDQYNKPQSGKYDCRFRAEFNSNIEIVYIFSENGNFSASVNHTGTRNYTYISGDCSGKDLLPNTFSLETSHSGTYLIVAPGEGAAIAAGSTPPEGTATDGTLPPGATDPDNPFLGPSLTGPGSDSPISDAALPLAVGAAALVTALGTLGLAFSDGTTPAEAFGELKALFTPNREEAQSLSQTLPADGRDPQEILSDPRFHDQVTDVNGKQWVYYRRPGDEAGDGWTSLEAYNQTKAMEKENKIWTDRYGWQTKQELYNSEQMAEKFAADNRQATVKFNEELKTQPTPPPAELPLAELPSYISGQERERFAAAVKEATQEFEQETDDILKELVASERRHKESVARSDKLGREIELEGKKATFALQLAEDTQKLRKEGYWIRNPNNSYALQIKNRLFNPLDPKGVQCGDLVKLKLEEVKKLAAEKFGEGVLVDMVEIEERTTKAPQGILDYLDSVVPYNHQAIRVITPDGESFIVDYWQALHAKGSTSGLMQPENNFTEGWNKSLSGDIVIEGNLQVYQAEQNKLPELIKEHGQQEGLNLWQKQTNTVIQKAALPPDQKEAQLRKVQTLVNYLGVEGKKIGY